MTTEALKGGITRRPEDRPGTRCYALVQDGSDIGLASRRCHRKARMTFGYQAIYRAPLCLQHARMLEGWINGKNGAPIDFAITMLARWAER